MSVSGYKNFAIFGANPLGKYLVDYLLQKKNDGIISSVSILTRSASGYEDLVAKGAKRITVDYTSSSSIASAVAGVDVIVSTCSNDGLKVQIDIAKIAKAQGVKLFVPSEFGKPTDGATEGFFAVKDGVKKVLREIDLPYAIIYNGSWPDWFFVPDTAKMFGIDFANGKVAIAGSGTVDIPFTHQRDAARFLAHVLTALPKEKIEWRTFRIEGEKISLNKIASEWEARTGRQLTLTYRPRSDFEEAFAKDPNDIVAMINLVLSTSEDLAHKPEELANGEWPEWNPGKVIDTILAFHGLE